MFKINLYSPYYVSPIVKRSNFKQATKVPRRLGGPWWLGEYGFILWQPMSTILHVHLSYFLGSRKKCVQKWQKSNYTIHNETNIAKKRFDRYKCNLWWKMTKRYYRNHLNLVRLKIGPNSSILYDVTGRNLSEHVV